MIKNRLEKNLKKLRPWAQRSKIEAFRLYDRDIPEFPFIVDLYGSEVVVFDKSEEFLDKEKNHLPLLLEALTSLFGVPAEKIILKKRERQGGTKQYEKLNQTGASLVVQESQARLKVNLHDYLDTGLFLDHRPIRQVLFKQANEKKFLNLFCYTGVVSVFAALGGAKTTSVDMSSTYLNWAQDNFVLNEIDLGSHSFINADVIDWLKEERFKRKYDLIFLDPPTFSNSKKMDENFEVERDQDFLVDSCMMMLNPGGTLYFSNNKRKFKLSPALQSKYFIKDISEATIPQDFHDKKIHNCFEIKTLSKLSES